MRQYLQKIATGPELSKDLSREEAKNAAIAAILSRIKLWDDVASIIQLNEYNQMPDNRVSIAV